MRISPRLLFGLLALPALPLAGQHVLAIKDGDQTRIVVDARDTQPLVLKDGKLQTVRVSRFMLGQGGEYLPVHVAVRNVRVETSSAMLGSGGNDINKEFHLNCDLESASPLDHVFLVIALQNDRDQRFLFLFAVGELEARREHHENLRVAMGMDNVPGRYELYLFSGGRELFHSMMPIGAMDVALNRMVADRIRDVTDAPVRPFIGPAPEHPAALRKQGISGHAELAFQIDAKGAVSDPSVVEASRPEFGEAALAVIRQWRFLPRVKHGVPVPSRAQMPFDFSLVKDK